MAGAVCGDHISPISDTTIMASAGAQCNHVNHVATQMPYAFTVAAACLVGYLVAGFTQSFIITTAVSIACLVALVIVIKAVNKRKLSQQNTASIEV